MVIGVFFVSKTHLLLLDIVFMACYKIRMETNKYITQFSMKIKF